MDLRWCEQTCKLQLLTALSKQGIYLAFGILVVVLGKTLLDVVNKPQPQQPFWASSQGDCEGCTRSTSRQRAPMATRTCMSPFSVQPTVSEKHQCLLSMQSCNFAELF